MNQRGIHRDACVCVSVFVYGQYGIDLNENELPALDIDMLICGDLFRLNTCCFERNR